MVQAEFQICPSQTWDCNIHPAALTNLEDKNHRPCISQLLITVTKYPRYQLKKREGLSWAASFRLQPMVGRPSSFVGSWQQRTLVAGSIL